MTQRYTAKDVHDLSAELEFRVMQEELKTITPTEWLARLPEAALLRLRRAAILIKAGARLVQADVAHPEDYDSPIVEDAYDPGIFYAIRQTKDEVQP